LKKLWNNNTKKHKLNIKLKLTNKCNADKWD